MTSFQRRPVSFLIVGLARSGTTFIQRLVCELNEVWVPEETHFWDHASREFDPPHARVGVPRVLSFLATLGASSSGTRRKLAIERAADRIRESQESGLWGAFEGFVNELSLDRPILGEKTPSHMLVAPMLTHVHSQLKVIAVVRDPRAIVVSQNEVPWGLRDAASVAWRWRLRTQAMLDLRDALGPERVFVASFEDAVASPDRMRTALASFLGAADGTMALGESSGNLFDPSEASWKDRALKDADPSRKDRWRTMIDPSDSRVVTAIAGPLMASFGYEVGPDAVGDRSAAHSSLMQQQTTEALQARTGQVLVRELRHAARLFAFPPAFYR